MSTYNLFDTDTQKDDKRGEFLPSLKDKGAALNPFSLLIENTPLKSDDNRILTPFGTRAYVDYAQLYANTHNETIEHWHEQQKIHTDKPIFHIPTCSMGFVRGKCTGGHQFAKLLLCGREWCKDCGKENSYSHQRRIARWFPKVMQMEKFGYLVITVPDQIREASKDKKFLTDFRTYAKRKLQRMGYDKGLIRYHWAGDDGEKWHPHLNILIEETYLSVKKMKELKNDLRSWFERRHPETFKNNRPKINLWYNYAKPGTPTFDNHKVHKLKYITRATLKVFNPELAKVIKGFRTTSQWGKWKKPEEKNTSSLVSLVQNICPHKDCRKPVKWEGGRNKIFSRKFTKDFKKIILLPLEGGYYEIAGHLPDTPPPPDYAVNKNYAKDCKIQIDKDLKTFAEVPLPKIEVKEDTFFILIPDERTEEQKIIEAKEIEDQNRYNKFERMRLQAEKNYQNFLSEKN